jgi:hypothetical protein
LNFGNPEKPEIMGQFSDVIDGMAEACRALGVPITGGNVSFYNETAGKGIHPTPVIGVLGLLEDATKVVNQWFKADGDLLYVCGDGLVSMGASEYLRAVHGLSAGVPAAVDLKAEKALIELCVEAAARGLMRSAHDCSDGGLAVALAESGFTPDGRPGGPPGGLRGVSVELDGAGSRIADLALAAFGEGGARVVVTDMRQAANALSWCVAEMERRYKLMSMLGVRNMAGYNQKVRDAARAGKPALNPLTSTPDGPEPLHEMSLVVVFIDELADLMMVVGRKVEELIARLAQKARAAGIHLILATQRPSVDVITGLIKANIPSRISFQVSARVDSRTILDQMGAEALLGQGDMLYLPPGTGLPQRVHGAFVADHEVHKVVAYLKQLAQPQYVEGVLEEPQADDETMALDAGGEAEWDPLYDQAVALVLKTRRASISLVQRHLRIGYNRAARLIEQMERAGMVSEMQSNGNREVLVPASASGQ